MMDAKFGYQGTNWTTFRIRLGILLVFVCAFFTMMCIIAIKHLNITNYALLRRYAYTLKKCKIFMSVAQVTRRVYLLNDVNTESRKYFRRE